MDTLSLTQEIDSLLETYLQNLHTYTTLRTQLSTLQTNIYQNISRANFHPIGLVRYGSDCYNYSETMTASTTYSPTSSDITSTKEGQAASLKMFGAFVPPSLKTAQLDALKMVQDILPQLLVIEREMRELEIRIRRARKFRGKEEMKMKGTQALEVGKVP